MFKHYLYSPGERPPFASVPRHLWGDTCDFDSDGNSAERSDTGWTKLYVTRRPDYEARVDVYPLDNEKPLVLIIQSDSDVLARKAALFLQSHSGGTLSEDPPR